MCVRHHRHSSHRAHQLAERARRMKWCGTSSEALLWSQLRSRQLGVQFRRQVVLLGRFIVDFLAAERRVVVEVDGGYHEEHRAADARRQRALELAGYRVLRFEAALVTERLAAVVECIREAVREP